MSIMEMKDGGDPEAGILPIPDCKSCDIELSKEQSKVSLLALHTGYIIDVAKESPALVQIRKGNSIADGS